MGAKTKLYTCRTGVLLEWNVIHQEGEMWEGSDNAIPSFTSGFDPKQPLILLHARLASLSRVLLVHHYKAGCAFANSIVVVFCKAMMAFVMVMLSLTAASSH